MPRAGLIAVVPVLLLAILATGCSGPNSGTLGVQTQKPEDKVVNLYTWSDYIAPEVLESFEKQTAVKVRVAIIETNGTLETRMLTGHSGYDLVVPTAQDFPRQIRSGAYLALDKSKLPNLKNLDPALMARVALNDPENAHGIVYAWGTFGLGYNERKVAEVLPGVPVNSWRLVFDPAYASKLASCGINLIDSPATIIRLVLKYLGRDPNSPTPKDLADAEAVLLKVRPYIRTIDSSLDTDAMANGDVCMVVASNGVVFVARNRAREAKNGIHLGYAIPQEGALLWFDMLAIPKDAPHAFNAHLLMNYLMDPQVAATNARVIGNSSANAAASTLLDASFAADPMIYPTASETQRLFVQTEDSLGQARAITRLWQKFKTGQ
jgi:putrescine transport system substrate-binding protein